MGAAVGEDLHGLTGGREGGRCLETTGEGAAGRSSLGGGAGPPVALTRDID